MAAYNKFQQMHHFALYGAQSHPRTKKYGLFQGTRQIMEGTEGQYGLLVWKKNELIRTGVKEYLLKIKPI